MAKIFHIKYILWSINKALPIEWDDQDLPPQMYVDSCGLNTQTASEEPGGPLLCLFKEHMLTEQKKKQKSESIS